MVGFESRPSVEWSVIGASLLVAIHLLAIMVGALLPADLKFVTA